MLCLYVYSHTSRGVFRKHYVCSEAVLLCTCIERIVEGCYSSVCTNIFAINLDIRKQETVKLEKIALTLNIRELPLSYLCSETR